jgi:hypothetical protein
MMNFPIFKRNEKMHSFFQCGYNNNNIIIIINNNNIIIINNSNLSPHNNPN